MDDMTCSRVVLLHLDAAALTDDQRLLLDRSAGTSRAVYNWGLAAINAWNGQRYAWLRERAYAVTRTEGEAQTLLGDVDWGTAPTSVDSWGGEIQAACAA
ncbi:hypothetical protein A6411_20700 [Prescottella equi]|uniref:helix-turn-helix domain-containing protein n=1 Tax=Rhodococcus hoagii TaxID=43767 RepID=UPI0009BE0FF5|nr:helix-turn-helix domain-containing protein [Prescottella equi]OQQ25070.1 hypothetical protein A6411_20700 [Prescottella equi]